MEEYLVTKNRELIHLNDINQFIAKNSIHIKKWQLTQEKEGQLILSIIVDDKFSDEQLDKINVDFNKKYGQKFDLIIKNVDKIEQHGSSKHHFLIQKLPVEKIYYKK